MYGEETMNPCRNRLRWTCLSTAAVIALSLSMSGAAPVYADQAPPVSFVVGTLPLDAVNELVLPAVDVDGYLREDAERIEEMYDGPPRFAAPHFIEARTVDAGTWERLDEGGKIWRLRVRSEGALSLNIGLTTFRLPEEAMLHLYDPERRHVLGPFTAADAVEGEFWSPILQGDEAVLELYVPENPAFEPELVIAQVSHDYRGFGRIASAKLMQGFCNNDVICPEGDPWRDDIRSEGVFTLGGQWYCSGQMMNSNTDSPPPYFLTAYHCGITTSNDQTVRVYWNYESPSCGMLCCGSLSDNQYGSVLKARYSTSDFCLIELSQDPDSSSNVYYSGWDATGGSVSSCVAIHHPGTDEKAISFNYDPITVTSYLGYTVPGNSTHWRVDDWEDGTTEGGSSGSGIWDPNHRLVGQLHGGYASCTSITSDWYGRLSVSWTGGGSSVSRLKDWLDPRDTGTRALDGRDPDDISTDIGGNRPVLGSRSTLFPIAPNPTRGRSQIFFDLNEPGRVEMEIFSASGRLVSTVPGRSFPAGFGTVTWDGAEAANGDLPAGVYFVRAVVNGRPMGTEKLVLLR